MIHTELLDLKSSQHLAWLKKKSGPVKGGKKMTIQSKAVPEDLQTKCTVV